jgi:hypothetical protein
MLALLYTLRVFGGVEASSQRLSPWLLAFSIFPFLGPSIIKRASELMDLKRRERRTTGRRGYQIDDIPVLQAMGVGASSPGTALGDRAARALLEVPAVDHARPHGGWPDHLCCPRPGLVADCRDCPCRLHSGARLQLPGRVAAALGNPTLNSQAAGSGACAVTGVERPRPWSRRITDGQPLDVCPGPDLPMIKEAADPGLIGVFGLTWRSRCPRPHRPGSDARRGCL